MAQFSEVFQWKGDPYNGRTIKSSENFGFFKSVEHFECALRDSLAQWQKEGVRGVWIEILLEHSDWVPVCAKLGFIYNNARDQRVVMTHWLPHNEPSTIPMYPFTSVGAAGIVFNSSGDVLLMKEKRGHYFGWKFPGGMADPGEDLFVSAEREVHEETGIACDTLHIIAFRHQHKFRYPECSDFYFLHKMRPKAGVSLEPKPNPGETADCKWFTREDIKKLPETEFSPFSRKMLDLCDESKDTKLDKIQIVSFNRKNTVYCLQKMNV